MDNFKKPTQKEIRQAEKDKEQRIKLADFYKNKGRMPTYEEMLRLFNFASKNAVAGLISRLEKTGMIIRDNGKLIPNKLVSNLKVMGLVEAGFPTEAEENMLDTMSLDEFLVENEDATYMLRVKGNSMRDAGILEGDLVLAERTTSARLGLIVVAVVDGKYTMKYLRAKNGKNYLEPANPDYPKIFPKEELKAEAVIRAVIRKY